MATRAATENQLIGQLDRAFPGLTPALPNVLGTKIGRLVAAEFCDPSRLAALGVNRLIRFAAARWALLKNPADLTDTQAQTLREMKRTGGILWRAYQLKEALREIFAGDLDEATTAELLDRWCARAQRSRIPEFVKAGRTICKHRAGIDAAAERGLSNGRHEGLNTKVRLLIRRAYGFHSAEAALALVLLACGPVTLELRYHTGGHPHSWQ